MNSTTNEARYRGAVNPPPFGTAYLCVHCKRFYLSDWIHCPNCGGGRRTKVDMGDLDP